MIRIFFRIITAAAVVVCLTYTLVQATDYPMKPITIINPMAPGGTRDVMARAFASVAEKYLGQPVVVVNKPGASGLIGGLAGAQAQPDGYNITVNSTGETCALEWEIANGRKPPFTRHDIQPIGTFSLSPTLVVVPYNSPWKLLSDLMRDCRTKPNYYAFGCGGLYGGSHLPGVVLAKAGGITVRVVPYKGGGEVLTATVGGHVDFSCQFTPTTIPLVRGNKLRALAVQSEKRVKAMPDIPTVKELGFDAQWHQWTGITVPKKTPAPVVEKLKEVVKKVAEDKTFIGMIENQGDEVVFMDSDQLTRFWDNESEMIAKLYKQLLEEQKKK